MARQTSPPVTAVGQAAALWPWAEGPGFGATPTAKQSHDETTTRSGWQIANEVWQEAGISWEAGDEDPFSEPDPAPDPEPGPGRGEHSPSAFHDQPLPGDGIGQTPRGRPVAAQPSFTAARSPGFPSERPGSDTLPPGLPAMPLSAPTFADSPTSTRSEAMPRRVLPRPPEPDELYRAWQGSVRRAAAGPKATTRRRGKAWQVVRAGAPAVIIVTVGVGAVVILTGKPGEVLADRAKTGSNTSPRIHAGATLTGASPAHHVGAFAGYPGQRGGMMVNSMASADGIRLAVGSADGHPAIWRHAAAGAWTLISATSPGVYQRPGIERLTSIAHGHAGWIAVGDVVSGAVQQSVVVTSSDGVTWRALDTLATFTGPGSYVTGVTAGPKGYAVVGKHVVGGRTFVAMWWSADLRNWIQGDNGGLNGGIEPSTAYAVAAVPGGFVAVGTHGNCHSVWTSADGRQWSVDDIKVPPGASSAMLSAVAVNGNRVVAAGYAVTGEGHIPIVAFSANNNPHWHQVLLAGPGGLGGLGAVTAITAAGPGFVATGQVGPPGDQRTVTWSSADGLTWSAATLVGNGSRQVTALTVADGVVTGTAQQGADPSVVTFRAP